MKVYNSKNIQVLYYLNFNSTINEMLMIIVTIFVIVERKLLSFNILEFYKDKTEEVEEV